MMLSQDEIERMRAEHVADAVGNCDGCPQTDHPWGGISATEWPCDAAKLLAHFAPLLQEGAPT